MSTQFWFDEDRLPSDSDDAFTAEEIDEIIDLVRDSSFLDDRSGLSIEERMTAVFGGEQPEWSGFQIYDGTCYVNCAGVMSLQNEELEIVLQFELSDDLESFIFSGLLIDGVEQPEGLIIQFEEQFSTLEWDEEDEDDDDHHDHAHEHGCDCGHHHHGDEDDEEDDYIADWGDDAAERFWYGADDDYDA